MKFIWYILFLCVLSVNVHAYANGTAYVPETAKLEQAASQAGFPIIAIWEIISSPGFVNLALIVAAYLAHRNSKLDRWGKILEIGFNTINFLKKSGTTDWKLLVNMGLKHVVDEINTRKDFKSLSTSEVEDLQKSLSVYAKRITGTVDVPMQ